MTTAKVPEDEVSEKSSSVQIGRLVLTPEKGGVTEERILELKYACCCDGNKVKMVRKLGKKQKENLVGCTEEGKR